MSNVHTPFAFPLKLSGSCLIALVQYLQADAGGSPSLVARGFTAAITSGSMEIEIPVPGDKVILD